MRRGGSPGTFRLRKLAGQALLVGLALAAAGCGNDRPKAAPLRPAGYQPERFPDIPLPPDYVLVEGSDQLAVVMAEGAVRRFEVSMIRREQSPDERPEDLQATYRRLMPSRGWAAVDERGRLQRWSRTSPAGGEVLTIETGRSGGRTTIVFRLRPASSVG